jgi:hypothetical protein
MQGRPERDKPANRPGLQGPPAASFAEAIRLAPVRSSQQRMILQVPGLHEHLPEARDNVRRALPIAKCHLSRTFGKNSIAAGTAS